MNISYNWLSQYVDIPFSPEDLVEKLTMAGIEVESISKTNIIPEMVIVAEILERNPHPDADKLSVCRVWTGKEELQIVCGAPNCNKGLKTALAQIGTEFIDSKTDKKLKIKKSKLRGTESYGMLCSSVELGIDGGDHSGIMELPDNSPVGSSLNEIYKSDTVYELEITSNRPDWLSFIGIAREIKALSSHPIKFPKINLPYIQSDRDYTDLVEILDYDLCPRYSGRIIRDVTVKDSPSWFKERLLSIGLRPINNIVDITNFVLFELGQPLHVFDLDELSENRVIVRRAKDKEKIILLDGKEYILSKDQLVIADALKPVALAGVMGGEHSGVTEKTVNILIESAYFNPANIRNTSRDLNLSSDSSHRFERGIDAEMIKVASDRTASLILELAEGRLCSELIDIKDDSLIPKPKIVECYFDNIRSILGINISNQEIITIFNSLELKVSDISLNKCFVAATSFRLDVEREADLAEEVLRIYGLSRIPLVEVKALPGGSIKNDSYVQIAKGRDDLISLGLTECINYSLVDKKIILKDDNFKESDLHEVVNPISVESSVMRPSLIFGILKVISRNISHNNKDLKIFEIGKVYSANSNFPEERYSCCIAMTGRKHAERFSAEKNEVYDFYDLKGLIESWFEMRRLTPIKFVKSYNSIFKPGFAADIILRGKIVGTFGEISSQFTKGIRIKNPLFVAVIEFEQVIKMKTGRIKYQPISLFPATTRDVAVVADENMENSVIINCIEKAKCKLLEKVEILDIYRDDSLGQAKKSIAYTLTFRNKFKTLTDKEVNSAHEMIRSKLAKELPIELR